MPNLDEKKEMDRILVVDDEPNIQRMLRRILRRCAYDVHVASSGKEAMDKIVCSLPDLILIDLFMPGVDGFEVVSRLKKQPEFQNIPVIMITGLDTSANHVKALDLGADDFISKTAAPEEIVARVRSHLRIKHLNDELREYRLSLENMVALRTAQLKNASLEVILRLATASEYRDNDTGEHIRRMSHYAAAIARTMNLPAKTVEAILYAAPMHDIGKIGIPDQILLKPGKLSPEEWDIMKMHPTIGGNILKGSKIGFVQMGAMIARTHHEKWDGSGYPQGLKGRRIPLAGRIVALADVFDALTSERPYKAAFAIDKSIEIIKEGRNSHFDPDVVDAFLSIRKEILNIKKRYQDKDPTPWMLMDQMVVNGPHNPM